MTKDLEKSIENHYFAEQFERERFMIRPYPIGRQDFKAIIEDGYAYVDKTERMYEMIKNRTFVFLSRPRRFGKSLLINTLQQYYNR